MQDTIRQTIEYCATASNNGTAHLGEIVKTLLDAGVESYYADYRAHRTTYYLPNGDTHSVALPTTNTPISEHFDAVAIKAAILGAQRGEVMYPQFKQPSQAAGCAGYIVWLAGKHVTYFGRKGEMHIEHFPSGK